MSTSSKQVSTVPNTQRQSGIVLHPTSLPSPYGIGTLGAEARRFVDWLAAAGQQLWQVLPLGPTGYGDSPYQSFSAFAGNPYLIDLPLLMEAGLLTQQDLSEHLSSNVDTDKVDYGRQFVYKNQALTQAFSNFREKFEYGAAVQFEAFCQQQASWLDDYALFMALKAEQGGASWTTWPSELKNRQPDTLAAASQRLEEQIWREKFVQFLFFSQWNDLRQYANDNGIQIMGDMPIFVALDSSDAWANRQQFLFDETGQPTAVAGVPPDYFSETGQLWGNPLYDWPTMQQQGFEWWIRRLESSLELYDLIRIDHFRGFAAYWRVPYPAENAMSGQWQPALGDELFSVASEEFGELPILAEDLGIITPDVEELRDKWGFAGMAILQFAFGDDDYTKSPFLPDNMPTNRLAYTGTHDNDTTCGWWQSLPEHERKRVSQYLQKELSADNIAQELLTATWHSPARIALAPLQDILALPSSARMNTPGQASGNWTWRLSQQVLTDELAATLRHLTEVSERLA